MRTPGRVPRERVLPVTEFRSYTWLGAGLYRRNESLCRVASRDETSSESTHKSQNLPQHKIVIFLAFALFLLSTGIYNKWLENWDIDGL